MSRGKKGKAADTAEIAATLGPEALQEIAASAEAEQPEPPPAPPDPSRGAPDAPPLEEAHQAVQKALERVRAGDDGAHLEPDPLKAWRALYDGDRPGFVRRCAEAKKCGANLVELRALLKDHRQEGRSQTARIRLAVDDEPPVTFSEILGPDCPAPSGLLVPHGYRVTPTVTSKVCQGPAGPYFAPVCSAPVVIVSRLKNLDGAEFLRLAWHRDRRWETYTAPRGECMDPRRLLGVSDRGLPVWGGCASDLAGYLHDQEAANMGHLPTARVSDALGWQGRRGELGFLPGRDWIRPDGTELPAEDLEEAAPETWSGERLYFSPNGPGDSQLADALEPSGTFEGWVSAVAPLSSEAREVGVQKREKLRAKTCPTAWGVRVLEGESSRVNAPSASWPP